MNAADPLARVSEYHLRHLVAHLAEIGRDRDMHRLLALEAGSGGDHPADTPRGRVNAWFTAKEQRADTEGYLDDVATAWRRAGDTSARSVRHGEPVVGLALEVRYALITSSLGSLARGIPPTLLAALVDAGSWPIRQALRYARQLPSSPLRVEALALLAGRLDEADREEPLMLALEAARSIQARPDWRVRAFGQIAAAAPDALRWRFIDEAMETIIQIGQLEIDENTATLLAAVPTNAWEPVTQALTGLPFTTAKPIRPGVDDLGGRPQPWTFGIGTFAKLVPRLPEPIAQRLAEAARSSEEPVGKAILLASCCSRWPHLLDEALVAVESVSQPELQAEAAAALAPHLPAPRTRALIAETVEAAHRVRDDPPASARVLTALAPLMPERQRTAMQEEALSASAAIEADTPRSYALRLLAPTLPQALVPFAAAAAETLAGGDWGRVVSALAARLPVELRLQALRRAQQIGDGQDAVSTIAAIATGAPATARTDLVRTALAMTGGMRSESLRALCIADLAPLLSADLLPAAVQMAAEISDADERATAMQALSEHAHDDGPGLMAIQSVDGGRWRAAALLARARRLDGEQREQLHSTVLAAARDLADPLERAQILLALAQLQGPSHPELVFHALTAARAVDPESGGWIEGLVELVSLLPQPSRAEVVEEALRAIQAVMDQRRAEARQIPDESPLNNLQVFWFFGYRQYDPGWALERLGPELAESHWPKVFGIVQTIPDELGRATTLASLAQYVPWRSMAAGYFQIANGLEYSWTWSRPRIALLPLLEDDEDTRSQFTEQVLEAARLIPADATGSGDRADVLQELAPHVHGSFLGRAVQLATEMSNPWRRDLALASLVLAMLDSDVLAAAATITTPTWRIEALANLAERLGCPIPSDILGRTLADIRAGDHAETDIIDFLALLPQPQRADLLDEALQLVLAISNPAERSTPLEKLVTHLAHVPRPDLQRHWSQILPVLARNTRPGLLSDLALILPVIAGLGDSEALPEISGAIEDAVHWWP
jgi:hypothetical protein